MDQATFEGLCQQFQERGRAERHLPNLTISAGRHDRPIVVLIHGIGGDARHWTDPVSVNPDDTWLFNLAAKPPAGDGGIVKSPPYQPGEVRSWADALRDAGMSWVAWGQGQSADLIQFAAQEAVDLLTGLEADLLAPYEADVAANGGAVPPLILLCHSRGGLVARAALKQLGGAGVPHLRKVITICTPHHGSFMPQLAASYNSGLTTAIDFKSLGGGLPGPIRRLVERRIDPLLDDLANHVRVALLHAFGTLSQGPGFDELIPSSATLQALAEGEQPLPGVEYAGYGGSDPTFVHFYLAVAGHVVHLLATASAFLVEQLARIPGVREAFGGLAELSTGDSAVSLSSSTWPEAFAASHQVFPVNHMQALIDAPLQQEVIQKL